MANVTATLVQLFLFLLSFYIPVNSAPRMAPKTWISVKRMGQCMGKDDLPIEIHADILKLDAKAFSYRVNITVDIKMDFPPDLKGYKLEVVFTQCTDPNFQVSSCMQLYKLKFDHVCEYVKIMSNLMMNNNRTGCPLKKSKQNYVTETGLQMIPYFPAVKHGNFRIVTSGYNIKRQLVMCTEAQALLRQERLRN